MKLDERGTIRRSIHFEDHSTAVAMNVDNTIHMLTSLSVAERLRVVEAVWNSLDAQAADETLSPEQRVELDRRLDDLKANPDKLLTWDQVLQRLREKL
ncbi:MAG: addiction module protein [Pirellulaceae bacterium]